MAQLRAGVRGGGGGEWAHDGQATDNTGATHYNDLMRDNVRQNRVDFRF